MLKYIVKHLFFPAGLRNVAVMRVHVSRRRPHQSKNCAWTAERNGRCSSYTNCSQCDTYLLESSLSSFVSQSLYPAYSPPPEPSLRYSYTKQFSCFSGNPQPQITTTNNDTLDANASSTAPTTSLGFHASCFMYKRERAHGEMWGPTVFEVEGAVISAERMLDPRLLLCPPLPSHSRLSRPGMLLLLPAAQQCVVIPINMPESKLKLYERVFTFHIRFIFILTPYLWSWNRNGAGSIINVSLRCCWGCWPRWATSHDQPPPCDCVMKHLAKYFCLKEVFVYVVFRT